MPVSGKSFLDILQSGKSGIVDENRKHIFAGRERHSSSRWNNLGYPMRAVRDRNFLLIWNLRPDLWPAGDPRALKKGTNELLPMYGIDEAGRHEPGWAFTDVDPAPSKSYIVEHHTELKELFDLSFGKRPEFELFDIRHDPFCMRILPVMQITGR
jgi:N-sulfoglucosamine sulfohydrolase